MKKTIIGAAAAAMTLAVAAGSAQATVLLDAGNASGLDQVHGAGGSQSGHSVFGTVDGQGVTWSSTDLLETNGAGHAFVDGIGNGVFGDLAFYLTSSTSGFTDLNFNMQKAKVADFVATIKVYDLSNALIATFSPTVGNGQNKYYLHGNAGETFSKVTWSASGDYFSSVRQFDLLLGPGGGAVPEPATWAMMILGFGAVGVMLRRRQAAHAA